MSTPVRSVQQTLGGDMLAREEPRLGKNVYAHNKAKEPAHNWYTTVAGFSPDFVVEQFRSVGIKKGDRVLDPFSGTGTTGLTSIRFGAEFHGVEANPFHFLVAQAKLNPNVDLAHLERAIAPLRRELQRERKTESDYVYREVPVRAIKEHLSGIKSGLGPAEMPHLEKWISPRVLEKLMGLKTKIDEGGRALEHSERRLLDVAFASILVPVSNMQLAGPKIAYRRKNGLRVIVEDAPVSRLFLAKIEKIVADLHLMQSHPDWGAATIHFGDARKVDEHLDGTSVKIAVTSPPYLNEVDYLENTRLELFFLELVKNPEDMRRLKEQMLRANSKYLFNSNRDYPDKLPSLPTFAQIRVLTDTLEKTRAEKNWGWDHPRLVAEYFVDMTRHLQGMKKVLESRGRYIVMVGDSAINGTLIPTDEIIAALACDLGFASAQVKPFRYRGSSRHSTRLRESVIVLST